MNEALKTELRSNRTALVIHIHLTKVDYLLSILKLNLAGNCMAIANLGEALRFSDVIERVGNHNLIAAKLREES